MTGETPNQRAAADFVRRDDAEKAGRMRYLYEVDIADPLLYELIINTEKLRHEAVVEILERLVRRPEMATDRKSTRLNSSHGYISYAVFCLKKKLTTSDHLDHRFTG